MSTSFQFDVELAKKNFLERKARNEGKQVDSSRLPAGSPMFYYCQYCGEHLCTLHEGHWQTVTTVCDACKILKDHGVSLT